VQLKFFLLRHVRNKEIMNFYVHGSFKILHNCFALSGLDLLLFLTQGVALCWDIAPFQGLSANSNGYY